MITLALLLIILGIISYLRIDKKCKDAGQEFNVIKGTLLEYVGILFGACALVILVAYTCITYLP